MSTTGLMDHDGFSDDDIDFDDLPQATLEHLEQQAFLSTQQPNIQQSVSVTNGRTSKSDIVRSHKHQHHPSSDYDFDDDQVVDLDAQTSRRTSRPPIPASRYHEDEFSQREAWRHQRYAAPSRLHERPEDIQNALKGEPMQIDQFEIRANVSARIEQMDEEALRARILELEQERSKLQKSAEDANNFALSRAGEISIVRANLERATNEYEQRIADLQKQHTHDAARSKAEVEAARREREKVETSNKFLEHDLAQEAERTRAFRKCMKDSNRGAQASPLSTPKKSKALTIRDGFDDDQVTMVSPSKLKDRSKPSTPRAGAKRKRAQQEKPAIQSPSLSFSAPASNTPDEGAGLLPDNSPQPLLVGRTRAYESAIEKAELMQSILNHRNAPRRPRTLEHLSKLNFPSAPGQSVSSLILDHLSTSSQTLDLDIYRLLLCDALISLWSRCLDEKFYSPLYDLTELLQYILMISPSSLSTALIDRLVALCQQTADIVALPTAKAAKTPSNAYRSLTAVRELINPLDYLNILHLTALNCESAADLTTFWSKIEFDFILLMLHKSQPITQITEMLQLLFTSIMDDTFGAIAASPSNKAATDQEATAEIENPSTNKHQRQRKNEADILDRLTVLLFETPQSQPPSTSESHDSPYDSVTDTTDDVSSSEPHIYTQSQLMTLRNTVLNLLHSLSQTTHGAQSLSTHRLAIPRLVRFLHEAILTLYASTPAPISVSPEPQPQPEPQPHDLAAAHVNTAVLLLARLNSADATSDIRSKLAAVPGGLQRWLVSLSRVAFAEGSGVVEAGLRAEVCEEAHRVLDEMLSPEEGDGVLGVFASGR